MNPYKPKVLAPDWQLIGNTSAILKANHITTVCEESSCPNRTECYASATATFMILGDTCSRACKFCDVKTGRGGKINVNEGHNIANAIIELGLRYVVITSVDRDDLDDFGSKHFNLCVNTIKNECPDVKIELLTPDFKANKDALDRIIAAKPYKIAHNEETVRRLSKQIRPQSDYDRSLSVLRYYSDHFDGHIKSSLMVGLGESEDELLESMQDLLDAGVKELTIGQYLQPSSKHYPVIRYYAPQFFEKMKQSALNMGFEAVASGVLVRSSYHAQSL